MPRDQITSGVRLVICALSGLVSTRSLYQRPRTKNRIQYILRRKVENPDGAIERRLRVGTTIRARLYVINRRNQRERITALAGQHLVGTQANASKDLRSTRVRRKGLQSSPSVLQARSPSTPQEHAQRVLTTALHGLSVCRHERPKVCVLRFKGGNLTLRIPQPLLSRLRGSNNGAATISPRRSPRRLYGFHRSVVSRPPLRASRVSSHPRQRRPLLFV
jgi:hypothetical protein